MFFVLNHFCTHIWWCLLKGCSKRYHHTGGRKTYQNTNTKPNDHTLVARRGRWILYDMTISRWILYYIILHDIFCGFVWYAWRQKKNKRQGQERARGDHFILGDGSEGFTENENAYKTAARITPVGEKHIFRRPPYIHRWGRKK